MALWKEVHGYEGLYLVSDDGRVMSLPRNVDNGRGTYVRDGTILKPGKRGRDGLLYEFVVLSDGNGTIEHKAVHRLVAEAFVKNPNGQTVVNHIDKNTLNNRADNLEWCDQQYNNEYGHNKAVEQWTIDGEKIAEYKSATYAATITGIRRTSIANVLNGWSKTAGGYIWRYSQNE